MRYIIQECLNNCKINVPNYMNVFINIINKKKIKGVILTFILCFGTHSLLFSQHFDETFHNQLYKKLKVKTVVEYEKYNTDNLENSDYVKIYAAEYNKEGFKTMKELYGNSDDSSVLMFRYLYKYEFNNKYMPIEVRKIEHFNLNRKIEKSDSIIEKIHLIYDDSDKLTKAIKIENDSDTISVTSFYYNSNGNIRRYSEFFGLNSHVSDNTETYIYDNAGNVSIKRGSRSYPDQIDQIQKILVTYNSYSTYDKNNSEIFRVAVQVVNSMNSIQHCIKFSYNKKHLKLKKIEFTPSALHQKKLFHKIHKLEDKVRYKGIKKNRIKYNKIKCFKINKKTIEYTRIYEYSYFKN